MRTSIKLYNSNKYEFGNNKYEKERLVRKLSDDMTEYEIQGISKSVAITFHLIAATFILIVLLILKIAFSL